MTGLTNMRQVALELIDRGPDETGSTIRLDFDNERIGVIAALELDTSIYGMAGSEALVMEYRAGLSGAVTRSSRTRTAFTAVVSRSFCRFGLFHRSMKIPLLVNLVKLFSLMCRFQRDADDAFNGEMPLACLPGRAGGGTGASLLAVQMD